MGESLRSAAKMAKEEIRSHNAEQSQREEARRQAQEAERAAAERLTQERAKEFLEIMRMEGIPQIGLYKEVRRPTTIRDKYGLTGMEVAGLVGPTKTGWLAARAYMGEISYDVGGLIPGVFVDEDGRTYDCGYQKEHEGISYVTELSENPTALSADDSITRIAKLLAERETA